MKTQNECALGLIPTVEDPAAGRLVGGYAHIVHPTERASWARGDSEVLEQEDCTREWAGQFVGRDGDFTRTSCCSFVHCTILRLALRAVDGAPLERP